MFECVYGMRVRVFVCVRLCAHEGVCACVCMWVYILCVCLCACACVNVHVSERVCMCISVWYVCGRASMRVMMCVYV